MSEWDVVSEQPHAPDDPWGVVKEEGPPSVAVDMAKTAPAALLKGTLQAVTTPATMGDLAQRGVLHAANKYFPDSGVTNYLNDQAKPDSISSKARDVVSYAIPGLQLGTYDHAKKNVEDKITGPIYDAKTVPGKIEQSALELGPSLATGGEGAIPTMVRALAGGAMGQLGAAVKPYLPSWAQPYSEPAATLLGTMTPRAITPNPMSAEQSNRVAAVLAKDPNFPMTAGQRTGNATTLSMEGRTPLAKSIPPQQEEAFTRGAMQEMGVPNGLHTDANLATGQNVGNELGNIRRSGQITVPEFAQLNKDVSNIRKGMIPSVGVNNTATFDSIMNDIKLGASQQPNVMNMTGARYNEMRGRIQAAIDGSTSSAEKTALGQVREAMDNAFKRSIGTDKAAQMDQLENQYANYNVLNNVSKPVGAETVTPQQVKNSVASQWGRGAANQNKGSLAPWADNASRVMPEFPKATAEVPPLVDVGGTLAGLLSGGLEGSVAGHLSVPGVYNMLRSGAARYVGSPFGQRHMSNQLIPQSEEMTNRALMARILANPTQNPMLEQQQ